MDGAPNVSEILVAPDRTGSSSWARHAPPKFVDGREIGAGSLCLLRPGSLVEVSTPVATTWLSVTAAPEAVEREAALLAGALLGPPRAIVSFASSPPDVETLRAFLVELTAALDSAPHGLHPEAAANVDRTLLRFLARSPWTPCLDETDGVLSASTGPRPSARSSSSWVSLVRARLRRGPLRATGLPERTLRLLFLEQFGESPVRVLRARRLCLVFDALGEPGVGLKQIRRVAESHGFWHMGQFSADYRSLLGERPSDTVRRARLLASVTGRH